MAKGRRKLHIEYHRDGTIWAKGYTVDGVATGYWEWFRKDGTRMRSGTFEGGIQVGKWTTYDRAGKVHKVTVMKAKPKARTRAP
jgi:antitoxin component YwqK of YwqJK toxin-antitoxin module